MAAPNVAIVHEKFTIDAGSERVVEQMLRIWPNAPIFCGVCDRTTLSPALAAADIRPDAMLQKLYRGGDNYAHLLALLPYAASRRHFNEYDLVVTSHHQFANRVHSTAAVVSYTHTPARWIWDPATRVDEIGGIVGRAVLSAFARSQRRSDRAAAQRLHAIAANSTVVAQRIRRWWGRDSTVIAPPVDTEFFTQCDSTPREDFFLLAGRLVPYKRPEVAVAAAVKAGVRLVVLGDGRARRACEAAAAANSAIEFVGAVDNTTLRDYYRRCRALLYPGREDFGIMPVEAQACGAPVLAVGVGGVCDTVVHETTGVLYPETPDPVDQLAMVLRNFESETFDSTAIATRAQRFNPQRFRTEFEAFAHGALRD